MVAELISQPDETFTYHGIDCARWGQCVVPEGTPIDPVPAVYSSEGSIEFGDFRLGFAVTEALIARVQVAIAYERTKAAS